MRQGRVVAERPVEDWSEDTIYRSLASAGEGLDA